jgi:autotransporter-associated beta strand protein
MKSRPVFFRISRNRRNAASAPSMRPKALSGSIAKYSRGLALSVLTLIGASQAPGAIYYWDSNSTTGGFGSATGVWGTNNFLNTDITGGAGGSFFTATTNADTLNFGTATLNYAQASVTVSGAVAASSIVYGAAQTAGITISGVTSITLGDGTSGNGGITVNNGAGAQTISTAITLNNTQTWTNSSTNTLTVQTGALSLGSNVLTITGSGNTTISSAIGGASGSIVKSGAGTLTLSGTNAYASGTTVNAGTLTFLNTNARPGSGTVTVAAGATLGLGVATTGSFFTSANVDSLFAGTLSGVTNDATSNVGIDTTNASFTYATSVGGSPTKGLVKLGANTLTLTGTNTYTGDTTISNGTTLQIGTAGSLGSGTYAGAIAMPNFGSFTYSSSANQILSGIISGTGSLTKNTSAASTLTLSNANTFYGATTNAAGILSLTNSLALQSSPLDTTGSVAGTASVGIQTNAGSTLTALTLGGLTGSNSLASRFRTTGGYGSLSALTLNSVASSNYSGGIADGATGMTLTKSGAGIQVLSGASTYTGATTISAGALQLSGSGGTNNGSTGYTLNGGSLLIVSNLAADGGNNNTRILDTATIALNGGSFIYRGTNTAATNSTETVGAISGTGNSTSGDSYVTVTFGGTNLATLTADSFSHSAGNASILVNGVNLGKNDTDTASVAKFIITAAPTLVGTTAAVTSGINSSAKDTNIVPFLVGEATSTTGGLGTATGTPNTFLTYIAGSGLRPLNPTDEFTQNAITSGNNTRITSATTASSTVAINSLVIAGADLTIDDTQTLTNTSGAILFTTTNAIKPSTTTGALALGAEGMVRVNSGITGTISAVVTGSNGLTQSGTGGKLVLSGANSYTGTTTVSAGTTLNIQNSSALGSSTATTVASGGKLQLQGGITVASGTSLTISQPTVSTFDASGGTATYNGVYTVRSFTASGTLNVTSAGLVDYLVVAGGGAGGAALSGNSSYMPGGGGAGGMKTGTGYSLSVQNYSITVGAGGSTASANGGNSLFDTITSTGGGGGGSGASATISNGNAGGSGGGGTGNNNGTTDGLGGTGIAGQGNNGGNGKGAAGYGGGGGGGAGSGGVTATGTVAGAGGSGLSSSITGSFATYAAGGGGAIEFTNTVGAGGSSGVGGTGGNQTTAATSAAANTGSGGGGQGATGSIGAGGSGIVVVRYVGAALENVSGDNTFNGAITLGSYIGIRSIAGTLTLGGAIGQSSSGYGITTLGAGTVALTNTNTYTGTTTVSGGTLDLQGSLSGTTGVTVNTGGTLLLNNAATPAINSGASMTVGGGTVKIDNSLSNTNQTFGSLTLTGTSILDFGTGSNGNTMTFASLSFTGTKLNVWNWSGSAYGAGVTDTGSLAGDTQDRLLFTANTSFGPAEDSSIEFFSGAGTGSLGFGQEVMFGGQYELVPITAVPEPATTALIGSIALCALIGYRERRRFTGFGKRTAARK